MNDLTFAGHLDEVDLVRRMDGALAEADTVAIDAHLAGCARCAGRLSLLGDWSQSLTRVLQETDLVIQLREKPAVAIRRPRMWQIAASIVLLATAGVAVSPLRAWFLSVGRTAWAAVTRSAVPTVSPIRASSMVTSKPSGTVFTISVPGPGAQSHVTVEVVAGDSVSATAVGTTGIARLLVLPDGLQLGTAGDYLIRVPMRLERLTILRDRQVVRVIEPSRLGERWELVFQRDTNSR